MEQQYSAWFDDAITSLKVEISDALGRKDACQFKRRFKNMTSIDAGLSFHGRYRYQAMLDASDELKLQDVLERKGDRLLCECASKNLAVAFFNHCDGVLDDVTMSFVMWWAGCKWGYRDL